MLLMWLQFIISAVMIIVAGTKLCLYADVISERRNLSKVWIGLILLGIVTSLPEVATSLASAVKVNAPDLALGNVLGSNIFNLMIIALLDILQGPGPITSKVTSFQSHILSAALVLLLSLVVILGISMGNEVRAFSLWNIGLDSIAITIIYIIGVRLAFRLSQAERELTFFGQKGQANFINACLGFIIAASLVVAGGIWLASIGEKIAEATGWGRAFVGTVFLAIVTSFPEIVVSVSALKIGSIDMAFGNIFGSNMINFFIIPLVDIAYRQGPLLSFVLPSHILTVCLVMFLTCVAMVGLIRRPKWSFVYLGWDAIVMIVGYLVGLYALFKLR